MLIPVVLAGGTGSRLWPASRALLPKQFIQFPRQEGSLFQATLRRLQGLEDISAPLVICNADHRFLVAEQLRQLDLGDSTIMLEPVGRNTAPAVAMAALAAQQLDPEAVLLVLPADHAIQSPQLLREGIRQGEALARQGLMVTFGIVPVAPETGYGYIEKGEPLKADTAFRVERFVEKPDSELAREYLASGNFYWNSGMFLFRAAGYLEELKSHAPDIYASCLDAFQSLSRQGEFQQIPEAVFSQCRSDSIDYAVMEKTDKAAVIPLDAGWNDLGAWDAMWEMDTKDEAGNVVSGDVLTSAVSNSYIQAQSRMVAAVGITDTVVVETADAVLVADRSQSQQVKQLVEQLQQLGRQESESHTLVYRPWGSYQSLASGDGYQVKHIVVNPGQSLSLQLHHRRSEHWTVVRGKGVVTCDEREVSLGPNESIFIPLGSKHRLANPGGEAVEIIEVQIGDYLGEDDIVRFEDRYGRVGDSPGESGR